MQRHLRRFAHGADEQADGSHRYHRPAHDRHGRAREGIQPRKNFGVVERAGVGVHQTDAQNKAQIGHAVEQEGFFVGKNRAGLVKPEANQQERGHAHALPAHKQLEQVVAHHQNEHGKGEQRNIGKETVVAGIAMHVARGVDVHHERNKRHHAHHHGRHAIDHEANFHAQLAQAHPLVNRLIEARALQYLPQHPERQNAGQRHTGAGNAVRGLVPQQAATGGGAENTHDGGCGQRRQHNGQ